MATTLTTKKHDLLFAVRRSQRYHLKRESFFRRCDKASNFVILLAGSTSIATFFSGVPPAISGIGGVIIVALTICDVIFDYSGTAVKHRELFCDFSELERRLLIGPIATEDDLAAFVTSRLALEEDEPPTLRCLDVICHNELVRAEGLPEANICPLKWYQSLFAQIVDICPGKLKNPAC